MNEKRRSFMKYDRGATRPSSVYCWSVLVTSFVRFVAWTPSFRAGETVKNAEASNVPVLSFQIGKYGKMTSVSVNRNFDRQL